MNDHAGDSRKARNPDQFGIGGILPGKQFRSNAEGARVCAKLRAQAQTHSINQLQIRNEYS
jgi:hypothetical protein